MKKIIIALLGIPTLLNAAAVNFNNLQVRIIPVIAVNNGGTNIGTDAGTTSYPKGGLNTMPTKDVGSEFEEVNPNNPSTKPFMAPAFSPPPQFAPAPAYVPPSNEKGTTLTPPR